MAVLDFFRCNGAALRAAGVVDPAQGLDALRDVRITGRPRERDRRATRAARRRGDLRRAGAIVAPGFIDMHVHLREPGLPEKETIATGTEAAVRGRIYRGRLHAEYETRAGRPGDARDARRARRSDGACCRVYPVGAITRARAGIEICDLSSTRPCRRRRVFATTATP